MTDTENEIVARAQAPVVHDKAQTVWENHCFVCHSYVLDGLLQHQRHHQRFNETTMTARSIGEAYKMIEMLEVMLGSHVVREMDIWCDPGSP